MTNRKSNLIIKMCVYFVTEPTLLDNENTTNDDDDNDDDDDNNHNDESSDDDDDYGDALFCNTIME